MQLLIWDGRGSRKRAIQIPLGLRSRALDSMKTIMKKSWLTIPVALAFGAVVACSEDDSSSSGGNTGGSAGAGGILAAGSSGAPGGAAGQGGGRGCGGRSGWRDRRSGRWKLRVRPSRRS